MSQFRAMPYAKALHEVIQADDASRADAVVAELEAMADVVDEVPEFNRNLVTPMIPSATKTMIIDQIMDALKITQPARRLLHVVQQHYRMEHMRDIATAYRDLVDRSLGRTRASVELAVEVDEDQRTKILDVLASVVGSKIIAKFNVNPDLLAGFRFQVGSRVFDGSLVGQLDRLRHSQIEQG